MVLVDNQDVVSAEEQRLREDRDRTKYWKKWGPYTAERQWAVVREDYSYVFLIFNFELTANPMLADQMAMPGPTSLTTWPVAAPSVGVRTASPVSRTHTAA